MLFNSIEFLIFFPLVTCFAFLTPTRFRWLLLLIASYIFYMAWEPLYAFLIMASTLVDYIAGLRMSLTSDPAKRKAWLILSLVCNLGLLFTFKYFNFAGETLSALLSPFGLEWALPKARWLLPVGISFYTFQTLSYTIEVYCGRQEPEKHLGIFALYVSFFPQLVAGPIERSYHLLPQFRQEHRFDPARIAEGLRLVLWGLFKKVVVADRLATLVDQVYARPEIHTGPVLLIATLCFAYQIYCDFSGYSDVAIGTARILGYDLMTNFNRPYHARSIAEFWKRWHISLSTWFRDYLYLPLGGSHVPPLRWLLNILVVFTLSGLWHGAQCTFVLWGALHALYYACSRITRSHREVLSSAIGLTKCPRLHAGLKIATTFLLVNAGWVLFRADTLSDAGTVFSGLFHGWRWILLPDRILNLSRLLGIPGLKLYLMLAGICFVEFVETAPRDGSVAGLMARRPVILRWAFYLVLTLAILNAGVTEEIPFVYFQF